MLIKNVITRYEIIFNVKDMKCPDYFKDRYCNSEKYISMLTN